MITTGFSRTYIGLFNLATASSSLQFGATDPTAAGSAVHNNIASPMDTTGTMPLAIPSIARAKALGIYITSDAGTHVGTFSLLGAITRQDAANVGLFIGPFVTIPGFSLVLANGVVNTALWNVVDPTYDQLQVFYTWTSGTGAAWVNLMIKEN